MQIILTDSQQCKVRVAALKDRRGQVVTPTAPPTWLTDNTDLLDLQVAADGLSCDIIPAGPLGDATVSCHAATGGGDITGIAQVTVTSGAPTTIELAADAPTEQP